jgi:hypothetical protein
MQLPKIIKADSKKQNVPTVTAAAVGFLQIFLFLTCEVVYIRACYLCIFLYEKESASSEFWGQ